jgi:hypothetical protein
MIGYGDTIGIHLIGGHHLDMIDGDIITMDTEWDGLIVGIIDVGQVIVGIILMDGIIIMDGVTDIIGIETLTYHIIQEEEEE